MKNLSFFKGLLIGGIVSISIWGLAIFSISTIADLAVSNDIQTVQTKVHSNNPPS